MMPRNLVCAAGSSAAGPRSVSMKPIRLVSGVRSSWLALATKSARIRSTARSRVRSESTATIRRPEPGGPAGIGSTIACSSRAIGSGRLRSADLFLTLGLRPLQRRAEYGVAQQGRQAGSEGQLRRGVQPVHGAIGPHDDQRFRQALDDGLLGSQMDLQRLCLVAQLLALPFRPRQPDQRRGRSGASTYRC